MADVFLSCSHADKDAASPLVDALRAAGLDVTLAAGDSLDASAVPEIVERSASIIVLWSARAAASSFVAQEVKLALSAWSGDRLVLAVLDGAPLPAGLRDLSAVDLSTGDAGIGQVVERAKSLVERRQPPQAQPPGPAPAKARHRLYLILGGLAALVIALAIGVSPFAPEVPKDSGPPPRPTAAKSWYAGVWPWIIGGGVVLLSAGVFVVVRRRRSRTQIAAGEPPVAAAAEWEPQQVFVSYSRQDASSVDRIVAHIEGAGYTVWIDREEGGHGTQRYAAPIVRAIQSARLVALMCSRNAFASDHVVREVYVAGDFRKPFLAFQLDQAQFPDDLIYFLSGFPRIPADPLEPEQLREEIQRYVA